MSSSHHEQPYGQRTSSWVTYDGVSLRECNGGGTQAAPSDTTLDAVDRDLARAGRVMSPEERLSRQQPAPVLSHAPSAAEGAREGWRYEDTVECEYPECCPEAAVDEPMKVQWAPVSEVDGEIGWSLTGHPAGNGGEAKELASCSSCAPTILHMRSGHAWAAPA